MCSAIWIWGLLVQLVLVATDDVYEMKFNYTDGNLTGADSLIAAWSAEWHRDLIISPRPDQYSVKFFPFAAVGGALWATGNCMSVPIINSIGLSMGLLIWGAANMLMGWAIGVFGLFGLEKNDIKHPALNYTGVALAVIALGIYSQIKASLGKAAADSGLQPLQVTAASPCADLPSLAVSSLLLLGPRAAALAVRSSRDLALGSFLPSSPPRSALLVSPASRPPPAAAAGRRRGQADPPRRRGVR